MVENYTAAIDNQNDASDPAAASNHADVDRSDVSLVSLNFGIFVDQSSLTVPWIIQ